MTTIKESVHEQESDDDIDYEHSGEMMLLDVLFHICRHVILRSRNHIRHCIAIDSMHRGGGGGGGGGEEEMSERSQWEVNRRVADKGYD